MTVDKSCCDQVEDADFEDTRLMIPKGWHQILTEVYGNYMEMPPEDKRVPTTPASKSVFLIRMCRNRGQTRTGGMTAERLTAYFNMPQERITDKRDGQVVISCGIGLQRRKGIGRILQGNHKGVEANQLDYELLFVNDGSRDGSQDILDRLAASDSGVRVISFSRNFGHEAA